MGAVGFIVWLTLHLLARVCSALSIVCCAPVVILASASRGLSKLAEHFE